MREWGFGMMVVGGCLAFYAALIMSPGLDAGMSGSVYNLAKGQDREFVFNAGLTLVLLGGVLYAAATIETAVMRAGGFRRKRPLSRQVDETPHNPPYDVQVL